VARDLPVGGAQYRIGSALVPQLLTGTARIRIPRRLAIFGQRYLPLMLVAPPVAIPRQKEYIEWHKSRHRDPGTVGRRSILNNALSHSVCGPGSPKKLDGETSSVIT
jgi:hypothetical protein